MYDEPIKPIRAIQPVREVREVGIPRRPPRRALQAWLRSAKKMGKSGDRAPADPDSSAPSESNAPEEPQASDGMPHRFDLKI